MSTQIFTQNSASAAWTIVHNSGEIPIFDVLVNTGSGLQKIIPYEIAHDSGFNVLTINFTSNQTGKVTLLNSKIQSITGAFVRISGDAVLWQNSNTPIGFPGDNVKPFLQ